MRQETQHADMKALKPSFSAAVSASLSPPRKVSQQPGVTSFRSNAAMA